VILAPVEECSLSKLWLTLVGGIAGDHSSTI
jgi:hypothetical protein